jgi:hypothetical protein
VQHLEVLTLGYFGCDFRFSKNHSLHVGVFLEAGILFWTYTWKTY